MGPGANPGGGLRKAITEGATFGLTLGLVECVAAYGVGSAPATDGLFIVAFDLVLGVAAGTILGVGAVLGATALRRAEVRRLTLLVSLVVLFAGRSGEGLDAAPGSGGRWAQWTLSVVLLLVAGRATFYRVQSVRGFTRLAAGVQTCAVLLLVLQSVRLGPVYRMYGDGGREKSLAIAAALLALGLLIGLPGRPESGNGSRPLGSMRAGAALAASVFLWLQAAAGPTPSAPPVRNSLPGRSGSAPPNVVLIVLDTVRADRLSTLEGLPTRTPSLAAFATRATTFTFAHATAPFTLASHASMFTGLLPGEHGAHHVALSPENADTWLDSSVPTLAATLAARGYVTGGIIANAGYVGRRTGLARGFQEYSYPPVRQYRYVPLGIAAAFRFARKEMTAITAKSLEARRVTNQSMTWIDRHRDVPFFLFVNYIDAHFPYRPPPPYGNTLPGMASAMHGQGADRDASAYDGEIAYLDSELGRLLGVLEGPTFSSNTLVIVTSDHGEGFGEHGCTLHDNSLYEELLHVPLLVRLPGQAAAYRSDDLVSLRSVPSIVGAVLSGLHDPFELAGRIAIHGPTVVSEHWFGRKDEASCDSARQGPVMRAIYDDRWKLVQSMSREELYDLSRDPGEARNLFLAEPEAASRKREQLLRSGIASFETLGPKGEKGVRSVPDEATRDALRALGYIR